MFFERLPGIGQVENRNGTEREEGYEEHQRRKAGPFGRKESAHEVAEYVAQSHAQVGKSIE